MFYKRREQKSYNRGTMCPTISNPRPRKVIADDWLQLGFVILKDSDTSHSDSRASKGERCAHSPIQSVTESVSQVKSVMQRPSPPIPSLANPGKEGIRCRPDALCACMRIWFAHDAIVQYHRHYPLENVEKHCGHDRERPATPLSRN